MPLQDCKILFEVFSQTKRKIDVLHVQSISCWAPACIGPYSQCYGVEPFLYLAGQIALDPPTMKLISGNINEQTKLSILNMERVLEVVKTNFDKMIMGTVFLTDLNNQKIFENEIYKWLSDRNMVILK